MLRTLEDAIGRVAEMNSSQWPERRRHEFPDVPTADVTERIDALRGECARIAKDLGIEAATLAPRAALEAIARSRPRTVDEIMESGGLLRWQANLIHDAVEKCLPSTRS